MGDPTSLAWVSHVSMLLIAGFTSSLSVIFDVERGVPVQTLALPRRDLHDSFHCGKAVAARRDLGGAGDLSARQALLQSSRVVTAVAYHRPLNLVVTAHTDCCARIFSHSSGQVVMTLEGHDDVVT